MGQDYGNPIYLVYECIGYGNQQIATYDRIKLKDSLKKAAKRMGIALSSINGVQYRYSTLSLNSTAMDNNIPNGGVITIKLKS